MSSHLRFHRSKHKTLHFPHKPVSAWASSSHGKVEPPPSCDSALVSSPFVTSPVQLLSVLCHSSDPRQASLGCFHSFPSRSVQLPTPKSLSHRSVLGAPEVFPPPHSFSSGACVRTSAVQHGSHWPAVLFKSIKIKYRSFSAYNEVMSQ